MSTRSKITSVAASGAVVAAGWWASTANGQPATTTAAPEPAQTGRAAGTSAPSGSDATTTAPTPTGAPAPSSGTRTVTGEAVSHHYGTVQVTATLTGGRVTALTEKITTDGERRSQMINAQAVPMIRSEILSAGSADVSTISGATYTTEAYLTSLQSALDQAE